MTSKQEAAIAARMEQDRLDRIAAKKEAQRAEAHRRFDEETRSDGSAWATETPPVDIGT